MKKSELKQLIREEIYKTLHENTGKSHGIEGYTDKGRKRASGKLGEAKYIPYEDEEMVIGRPGYLASAYDQAAGGRKIDSWEKLVAVLNSFDVYAEMADGPRAMQKRANAMGGIKNFLSSYNGPKNWDGLNDNGKAAVKKIGLQ